MKSQNPQTDPSNLFTILLYLWKWVMINSKHIVKETNAHAYSPIQRIPIHLPVRYKTREYKSAEIATPILFEPNLSTRISRNERLVVPDIVKAIRFISI